MPLGEITPKRLVQIREKPWFVSGKEVGDLLNSIDTLRAALEPFADEDSWWGAATPSGFADLKHVRRARFLLTRTAPEAPTGAAPQQEK